MCVYIYIQFLRECISPRDFGFQGDKCPCLFPTLLLQPPTQKQTCPWWIFFTLKGMPNLERIMSLIFFLVVSIFVFDILKLPHAKKNNFTNQTKALDPWIFVYKRHNILEKYNQYDAKFGPESPVSAARPPICTFYPSPPHPSLLPLISPLTQGVPSALAYTHSHKLLKRFKVCFDFVAPVSAASAEGSFVWGCVYFLLLIIVLLLIIIALLYYYYDHDLFLLRFN